MIFEHKASFDKIKKLFNDIYIAIGKDYLKKRI
jgi:hypothetical protein